MTPPIIIDIEASGFGSGSYPIEIGYVNRSGKAWCSLIKPCDVWLHWNPVAETLHHIPREMLVAHGKSVATIAHHLNDTLLNQTVYSDGWLHDFTWLNCLFHAADVSPHFKLEDLRTILTPYQQSVWHKTKQSILNELQISRHRASADATVLQMTWLKTAQMEALACA
jgi:hypothetical protein